MDNSAVVNDAQATTEAPAQDLQNVGPEQTTAENPQDQTPPAPSWEEQELPEGHPQRASGLRTWGDLNKRYESSSNEARRWQTQAQAAMDRVADLLVNSARQPQAAPPPQQQQQNPAANAWFGYGSKDAYLQAMRDDLTGTRQKEFLWLVENNPQFAEAMRTKLVQPALEPLQSGLREQQVQAFGAFVDNEWKRFESEFPEFAPGKALHNQLDAAIKENPFLRQMVQQHPYDAWRYAAADLQRKVQGQQLKAAETKMQETRGRSVTARPGAGGAGTPQAHTMADRIRQRAEEARAKGENISEDRIAEAIQQAVGVFGPEQVYGPNWKKNRR